MNNEALERRLQAINALMTFSYGSLWIVGENIWKEKLVPHGYDAGSTRIAHPGICLQYANEGDRLHAAVPMLYGTSSRSRSRPAYEVKNFFNEKGEEDHVSYFGGCFGAVPIEIEKIGCRRVVDTDLPGACNALSKQKQERLRAIAAKRDEELKNVMRPNGGRRQLNTKEVDELRNFVRKHLAIA